MQNSRKVLVLLSLLIVSQLIVAQSKKTIIEKGIVVKTTYKQDLEDGDRERKIDKIETYNDKGDLVDLKVYNSNGKYAKDWFQYKYNEDGKLIEEIEYDSKQNIKDRTVYKYVNGLKTSKEVFDRKGRLSKRTTYEYEFR